MMRKRFSDEQIIEILKLCACSEVLPACWTGLAVV